MSSKLFVWFFVLIILISSCVCYNIDFIANPNCVEGCQDPWVIYGCKHSKEENTHYLYGAIDTPTFIMLAGSSNSSLSIDWHAIQLKKANSISFNGIHNFFGVSIQNIILFNDANDTGKLDNVPLNQKVIIPAANFQWDFSMSKPSNATQYPVYFSTHMFKGSSLFNTSGISINLTSYIESGRGDSLPHLLVSPNSTLLELSIDDMFNALNKTSLSPLLKGFDHPRFAIDMMIFGSKAASSFSLVSYKSLDDEHTPGIFSIHDIVTETNSFNNSGFMQWRPVAYVTEERNINFATRPTLNGTLTPVNPAHLITARHSLVNYLFGNDTQGYTATQTVIAFGRPKDGFYTAYNCTIWSFSFGLGPPPVEGFSVAIIAIISIGIGIPVVILAFATLFWCVSKSRRT